MSLRSIREWTKNNNGRAEQDRREVRHENKFQEDESDESCIDGSKREGDNAIDITNDGQVVEQMNQFRYW